MNAPLPAPPAAPCIDLLPQWRRQRRARRRVISRWITACTLVGVASLAPAGAAAFAGHASGPGVGDRIARSERSIAHLQGEQPVLRRELAALQRTSVLLNAIQDRPDWRPLLHALTHAAGPARFERIETAIVKDGVPELRVTVTALVESQSEARAMVLRFEELAIFDEVKLISATRTAVAQTEVVRCEISARRRMVPESPRGAVGAGK
jgi:hypothetical protein